MWGFKIDWLTLGDFAEHVRLHPIDVTERFGYYDELGAAPTAEELDVIRRLRARRMYDAQIVRRHDLAPPTDPPT